MLKEASVAARLKRLLLFPLVSVCLSVCSENQDALYV